MEVSGTEPSEDLWKFPKDMIRNLHYFRLSSTNFKNCAIAWRVWTKHTSCSETFENFEKIARARGNNSFSTTIFPISRGRSPYPSLAAPMIYKTFLNFA